MRSRLYLVIQGLILLVLLGTGEPGFAAPLDQAAPVRSILSVKAVGPLQAGSPAIFVAELKAEGQMNAGAVKNELIKLIVDGTQERRARTDETGTVELRIRRELSIGVHTIEVVYDGSTSLLPSRISTELVVTPVMLEIHVLPPMSNVQFSLDGQLFTSNDAGVAKIEVEQPGTYRLASVHPDEEDPNRRIKFSRWRDEVFVPERNVTLPLPGPLQVGFDVSYPITQEFVDLAGRPVPLDRITSLTVKSSHGRTFEWKPGQEQWIRGSTIARRAAGLEETKIQYSLDGVQMDGSNVVNQSQQRFYVNSRATWKIELLLYSAEFSAKDGLFGFPVGTGIRLEYPDAKIRVIPWDRPGYVHVDSLPRGAYRVSVQDPGGMSPPTPMALSQDQEAALSVLTYLDLGVASSLGLALAVGLLFVGRPRLRAVVRAGYSWLRTVPAALMSPLSAFRRRFPRRSAKSLRVRERLDIEDEARDATQLDVAGSSAPRWPTVKLDETVQSDVWFTDVPQPQDQPIAEWARPRAYWSKASANQAESKLEWSRSRQRQKWLTPMAWKLGLGIGLLLGVVFAWQNDVFLPVTSLLRTKIAEPIAQVAGTGTGTTVTSKVRTDKQLPPPAVVPGDTHRTFVETGHTVTGLFLDYWSTNGGLKQFGLPVSDVFGEVSDIDGMTYTVQYFERAVFEFHPEWDPPSNVILAQLGNWQYKVRYPNGSPVQMPNKGQGSLFFPETGKWLGGKFREYWQSHGGLELHGYPITDEFIEVSEAGDTPYLVQYFEKGIFEYHPENLAPFDVLLSHVGTLQYEWRYGGK